MNTERTRGSQDLLPSAIVPGRRCIMQYSYEVFLKELGVKLRQMRKDRGWSLRHMVLQHRFHITHWQGFEKGKAMSMPSLLRVCEVFETRLEDLVAGLGLIHAGAAKAPPDQADAQHLASESVSTKSVPAETGKRATTASGRSKSSRPAPASRA